MKMTQCLAVALSTEEMAHYFENYRKYSDAFCFRGRNEKNEQKNCDVYTM